MLPLLWVQYSDSRFSKCQNGIGNGWMTRALLLGFVVCFSIIPFARLASAGSVEAVVETDQLRRAILEMATKLKLKTSEVSFSIDIPGVGRISHRSDESMLPASTMKVVVAAAALDLLGPKFPLKTDLVADGAIRDGVLQGDLRVVGRGDPAVVGREDPDDVLWEIRPWVQAIRDQGITSIAGKVLADVRYFAGPGFHPDWPTQSAQKWYYAPSGALNLNDNCLDLIVGPVIENQVKVEIQPFQPLARIVNRLKPINDSKKHLVRADRKGSGWEVVLSGSFLAKSGAQKFHVAVPDPATNFVGAFSQVLTDSGLAIEGGDFSDLKDSQVLASISHPLVSRLPILLKNSQNLYADSLLRIIGREKGGKGDFTTAAKVLMDWSQDRFPNCESLVFRDGSGLSRKNRLTASFLQQLMEWTLGCVWGEQLIDSLAVGGVDGTLRKRLKAETVRGKVLAKTGSLTGVSSLTGILRVEGTKSPITFALICNRKKGSASIARQWQDRTLEYLQKRIARN